MFDIYDPRRGKDFEYRNIDDSILFSSLKKRMLFLETGDERQVFDERIVGHLARVHFLGTRLFLQVDPSSKKITSELKTRFKNGLFLHERKNEVALIVDTNSENIKILEGCYRDLADWEEWNICFAIPEKESTLKKQLPRSNFGFFELLDLKDCFKAIFSVTFETPILWLMFFEESKFDDVIQSVPLV